MGKFMRSLRLLENPLLGWASLSRAAKNRAVDAFIFATLMLLAWAFVINPLAFVIAGLAESAR